MEQASGALLALLAPEPQTCLFLTFWGKNPPKSKTCNCHAMFNQIQHGVTIANLLICREQY